MLLYQQHFRDLVGKTLMQMENLGDPGPYVPFFYQIGLSDLQGVVQVKKIQKHITCNL